MSHSSPVNAAPPSGLSERIRLYLEDAPSSGGHSDAAGANCWELLQEAMEELRICAQCAPTPSDEMVETACAAYAKATDYYVEFHRGLSSASADRMRVGMRAALSALTSPEHQSAPAHAATHNSGEGDPSVMPDYAGADTAIQPQCALTQDQIAAKWQEAMDKWEDCLTRIEQMRDALANVLGLCDLLSHRDDIPSEVKEILTDGWRRREAQSVWEQSSALTRPKRSPIENKGE